MRSFEHLQERYNSRKKHYTKEILGKLEAFTECPMDEWGDAEFDRAIDLLRDIDQETQAAFDQYGINKEMTKCILCGKMTTGSIGKAGIKWSFICQECKDIEDEALLRRIEGSALAIKKVVDGIDGFAGWLKYEGEPDEKI